MGLEAGGELEAGRELFLTVAAVPTAILEGWGRHRGREAEHVPLATSAVTWAGPARAGWELPGAML